MSDSGLKLSEETEREARERLAAQQDEFVRIWESKAFYAQGTPYASKLRLNAEYHRRRAASLRGK